MLYVCIASAIVWMRTASSASEGWQSILALHSTGAYRRVEDVKLRSLSGNVYSNILRKIKTKKQWLRSVSHICAASFTPDACADANAKQTKRSASASYAIHTTLVIRNTSWGEVLSSAKSSLAQKRQKRGLRLRRCLKWFEYTSSIMFRMTWQIILMLSN